MEEASFIKLTLKSQMYLKWSYFYFLLTVVSEIIMNYACNIHTYEDQTLAFELFFYFRYEKSYGYNNDEMTPKTHYQYEGTFLD